MIARTLVLPALILAAVVPAAPAAAELPQPVRAMIEAAIATGKTETVTTVAEIARTANPADIAEIDALIRPFTVAQAARTTELAAQRLAAARVASQRGKWSGNGQIGGFQSSGNTDTVGVTTAVTLQRLGGDLTHRFRASADYQRANGATSREQFLFSWEPRYQFSPALFVYGLTQFERNRLQGVASRYAVSGGLGYKVVDRGGLSLSVKAGPALRQTNFIGGGSDARIAGLIGLDFDWQISDAIKLTQDTNGTAEAGGQAIAIIDSANTSIDIITGLEASITDKLSARLSYSIEYDSNPPLGAVKTDTLTRFTLIYGF